MRRGLCALVALSLVGVAGQARADVMVGFVGPHPIDPTVSAEFCGIEGPHLHAYQPHKPVLYVQVEGRHVFVGDPTPFDKQVPRHAYYGHHPLFWVDSEESAEGHYCYITGPHHHLYAPPPNVRFKVKGGVYWFVGKHPRWYAPRAHVVVDEYYAGVELVRPVVTVTPPSGFVGVVIGPGGPHVHGHVQGGVYVAPPSVRVSVPVPSVNVVVGGGGVVYGAPVHGHPRAVKYKYKRRGPPGHAPAWGHRGKRKGKGKWK